MTDQEQTLRNQRELLSEIKGIGKVVSEIEKEQVAHRGKLDSVKKTAYKIETKVEKIEHTLNGNGSPGLKERIGVAEVHIEEMQGDQKAQDKRDFSKELVVRSALIGLVASGISIALTFFFTLFRSGSNG